MAYTETSLDLQARLKLDQTSGTTATDSSGNSRNGTLTNFTNTTTCWLGEKRNGGLDFGQGTDDTCTFSFPVDTATLTKFTAMSFIKWDGEAGGSIPYPRILHLGANLSGNGYWYIYLNPSDGPSSEPSSIGFGLSYRGGSGSPTESWWETERNSFLVNSGWRHIAVSYDATAIGNNPIIYIDGTSVDVELGQRANASRSWTGSSSATAAIGQVVGNTNRGLDGVLSDVRLYSRIVSADQIYRIAIFKEPTTVEENNFSNDFTINSFLQNSKQQFRRDDTNTTVDQVPLSSGNKGPINIRNRTTPYKVTKG